MYSFKDQVADAVAGVVWAAIFLVLWCAGAVADLAIVGM
tara:strand:+ start:2082 stop:2198 length:117 start_codon:yes stop_codon:yes gene_type:complete